MKAKSQGRGPARHSHASRPAKRRGLIGRPVGRGYNSDPDDVVKTKAALERGGFYRRRRGEPLNPYPDKEKVDGIGRVQRLVGERPTGALRPGDKAERVAMAFLSGGGASPDRGEDGAASRFGVRGSRRGFAGRKGVTGETLEAQVLDDWSEQGLTIQPPFALPEDTNRALAEQLGDAINDLIENPYLPRAGFVFPQEVEDGDYDEDDEGDDARHPLDFSNLPWRDECQAQYEDDIRNCEHWSSIAPDGLGPSVFERCERIAGERLGQCVQGRGERPATALPFNPRIHRWRN